MKIHKITCARKINLSLHSSNRGENVNSNTTSIKSIDGKAMISGPSTAHHVREKMGELVQLYSDELLDVGIQPIFEASGTKRSILEEIYIDANLFGYLLPGIGGRKSSVNFGYSVAQNESTFFSDFNTSIDTVDSKYNTIRNTEISLADCFVIMMHINVADVSLQTTCHYDERKFLYAEHKYFHDNRQRSMLINLLIRAFFQSTAAGGSARIRPEFSELGAMIALHSKNEYDLSNFFSKDVSSQERARTAAELENFGSKILFSEAGDGETMYFNTPVIESACSIITESELFEKKNLDNTIINQIVQKISAGTSDLQKSTTTTASKKPKKPAPVKEPS